MANDYSSCCTRGSCLGSSSDCFCDVNCHLFEDCCEDVPQDCQQQGNYHKTSILWMGLAIFTNLKFCKSNATANISHVMLY